MNGPRYAFMANSATMDGRGAIRSSIEPGRSQFMFGEWNIERGSRKTMDASLGQSHSRSAISQTAGSPVMAATITTHLRRLPDTAITRASVVIYAVALGWRIGCHRVGGVSTTARGLEFDWSVASLPEGSRLTTRPVNTGPSCQFPRLRGSCGVRGQGGAVILRAKAETLRMERIFGEQG